VIIGICGLPYSGSTSLFKLTAGLEIPGHVVTVKLMDDRLSALQAVYSPKKITPAELAFRDVGSGGQPQGKRMVGPEFGSSLATCDGILVVVRAFGNPSVPYSLSSIDPEKEYESLELEFIISDLERVEKRLETVEQDFKRGKKELEPELSLLAKLKDKLEREEPLRELELSLEEEKVTRGFGFLSMKPSALIVNIDEQFSLDLEAAFETVDLVLPINAALEAELLEFPEPERAEMRNELGLPDTPGSERLLEVSRELLQLAAFYTGNPNELRSWLIRRGTSALEAAGKIHSDIQKGFIRAEVIGVGDLIACGSLPEARSRGLLRAEGKEYVVQDGDVIQFRFNV
jgi:GTP-binding protein YchF